MNPFRSAQAPTIATIEAAFRANEYRAALAQVDSLLAAGTSSPYERMNLLRRGVLAVDRLKQLDRMAEAERWSAEAVADPRTAVPVIVARARILHELGHHREAADTATAAIEFSPPDSAESDGAYLARVRARFALADWAGALADADAFMARRGAAGHHALAVMAAECIVNLDLADRLVEADRWTVEALAAGPNVWASNLRAPLQAMTGRLDQAIGELHRLLAEADAARAAGGPQTKQEADVHSFLARGYLDRGDVAQAQVHVTAALACGGEHAVLAGVMTRMSQFSPAVEAPPASARPASVPPTDGQPSGWERPASAPGPAGPATI